MKRWLIGAALATAVLDAGAWAQTSRAPTNQSAEEIVIKEKLNGAGVTQLKDLKRNRDGSWNGRGMKGDVEVAVVVDADGNVIFH